MIRLTAYIALALSIALAAFWISSNPGQVLVTWQGWEIRFSTAVMVFMLILYTALIWGLLWLARKLNIAAYFSSPERLAAKRAKGESDLDQAWSAYALADYKQAMKFGLRAKSKLGQSGSVLRLLASATAASGERDNPYHDALKSSPISAPWVEKQELDQLRNQKSWRQARDLVQKLLTSQPKNHELLALEFNLAARLGNWQDARTALVTAKSVKGALKPADQKHYAAVIEHCLSLEAKAAGRKDECISFSKSALKNDPAFSPAALTAARAYIEQDDKKSAENILAAIWKRAPNDEVAELLTDLYPLESSAETFRRIKKITEKAPEFAESQHLLAEVAIRAEHWPEARRALESALDSDRSSKKTYQLMARLEQKQKNDADTSKSLIEKSKSASDDNRWRCQSCRKSCAHYLPNCPSCHEFDTIKWSGA